jgi:hypothetical protein
VKPATIHVLRYNLKGKQRNMNRILTTMVLPLFAVLLIPNLSHATVSEDGDWSNTVNGVQGRLSLTADQASPGTKIPIVYLELRNVSNTTIELYFDPMLVQSSVVDMKSQPVEKAMGAASVLLPQRVWLTLPYDGALRFRISVTGYSVSTEGRASIQMVSGNWFIRGTDDAAYSVAASFSAKVPSAGPGRPAWTGTLVLPPVRIP